MFVKANGFPTRPCARRLTPVIGPRTDPHGCVRNAGIHSRPSINDAGKRTVARETGFVRPKPPRLLRPVVLVCVCWRIRIKRKSLKKGGRNPQVSIRGPRQDRMARGQRFFKRRKVLRLRLQGTSWKWALVANGVKSWGTRFPPSTGKPWFNPDGQKSFPAPDCHGGQTGPENGNHGPFKSGGPLGLGSSRLTAPKK